MLGWLTGKTRSAKASYLVWLTEKAKFNGIEASLRTSFERDEAVILVVHFDETASVLGAALEGMEVKWAAVKGGHVTREIVSASRKGRRVVIVRGSALDERNIEPVTADSNSRVRIAVVELHPTDEDANRCAALADALPWEATVEQHTSLEDPVLRLFVNDQTKKMLRTLGLNEQTPIEHSLVDKSVSRVQAKVRAKAKRIDPRPTAAQWLEHNCPELAEKVW